MFDCMGNPGNYIPPCESKYFDRQGNPIGYYENQPPQKNEEGFYEQPEWIRKQREQNPFWNMPPWGSSTSPNEELKEQKRRTFEDFAKTIQKLYEESIIDVTFEEVT